MAVGLFLQAEEQPWILWDWLFTHVSRFTDALQQHIELTLIAVALALVISVPLGVAAHRWRAVRNPAYVVFGIFYTIPSIALFALLIPYTGLSATTAEIGLVGYAVLIILRNVVVGLDSVSPDVVDAADGMGYRPIARLLRVELPLALPAIFAGVRIATVTTIGLVTITAGIGLGGLRQLNLPGVVHRFRNPPVVAAVPFLPLSLVAGPFLFCVERPPLPWSRGGCHRRP